MLRIYKLAIAKKTGSPEADIESFLELYNGHEGYSLMGIATTEGELDRLIGKYVRNFEHVDGMVQALVIEDNYGSVVDYLFERLNSFRWSDDHRMALGYITEYFHGDHDDMAWTDYLDTMDDFTSEEVAR